MSARSALPSHGRGAGSRSGAAAPSSLTPATLAGVSERTYRVRPLRESLGRGRAEREGQRLGVGARAEGVGRGDRLFEVDRRDVVGGPAVPGGLAEGDLQRLGQRERAVGEVARVAVVWPM